MNSNHNDEKSEPLVSQENDSKKASPEPSEQENSSISKGNLDASNSNDTGANGNATETESKKTQQDYSELTIADEAETTNESAREDSDEEDEDGDEDEEPPLLKYSRLQKLPPTFFEKDPVSASRFHENVFIFGTHSGLLHFCQPDFTPIRTFKAQRASILSLYCDGNYFASGSMDGTIVIGSLTDEKDVVMFDYKRPIHAVVLDKNYLKSRAFVYGGMSGKVIYSYKSWLDLRVETVLDEDAGPIVAIESIDSLLIWMNDMGITVYHISAKQVISKIAKPSDSFRSDLYWPRISFPEIDRVLIAWGNYIWSLKAITKSSSGGGSGAGSSMKSRYLPSARSLSFRSVVEKKIEIEHVFKVDFLISGIASYKDDLWMVLAYNVPEKDEATGKLRPQNPDLRLVSSIDGTTKYEEEIEFSSAENLGLNDYNLGTHIGEKSVRFFIVSARGAVIAQQVQLDDQLQWYLDRGMFYTAWQISQHLVSPNKRLSYGIRHIDDLLKDDKWEEASAKLSEILFVSEDQISHSDARSTLGTKATDSLNTEDTEFFIKEVAEQWVLWCSIFINAGHVEEITQIVPLDPRWNIPKKIYSQILEFWIKRVPESDKLFDLLQNWVIDLYDAPEACRLIEARLEEIPSDTHLRRTLCYLHEKNAEPQKAVKHLIDLRDPNIVQFLTKNHLLSSYLGDLPRFAKFKFNSDDDIEKLPVDVLQTELHDFIDTLVQSRQDIDPKAVLQVMFRSHMDVLNYFYLQELTNVDEHMAKPFENEQIQLFCQYERLKLLNFLTTHDNYDLQTAISLCEENGFSDELVYLLGKLGDSQKAMALILEDLNDPYRAIKFAKQQKEESTWNQLLEYSYSRPEYIKALLEMADDNSNAYYNPMTILQNLNTNVHIEGLQESVINVANDLQMTLLVNQLILQIVDKRTQSISQNYFLSRTRGYEIEGADLKPFMKDRENMIIVLQKSEKGYELLREADVNPAHKATHRSIPTMKAKLEHLRFLRNKFQSLTESEDTDDNQ